MGSVLSLACQPPGDVMCHCGAHPVLVLDDVLAYGGQRGPLAVVGGTHGTALVGFELAHCKYTHKTR